MSSPARRNNQDEVYRTQRRELWVVFFLMIFGFVLELCGMTHATKSMVAGAILAYVAQSICTKISFRITDIRLGRTIVDHLYMGEIAKWIVTVVGFAWVFRGIGQVNAFSAMCGYVVMQIAHVVMMLHIDADPHNRQL